MDIENISDILSSIAAIATVIGLYAIWLQIRIMRREHSQKTLEMLDSSLNSSDFIERRPMVLGAMSRCKNNMAEFRDEDAFHLRKLLNTYELLCMYVERELIDESIFKEFWDLTLINDYHRCMPFMSAERERMSHPKLWSSLEDTALRWS